MKKYFVLKKIFIQHKTRFGGSSKERHVNGQLSTLVLNQGGNVDLTVSGGSKIKKNLTVGKDLTVKGDIKLTGQLITNQVPPQAELSDIVYTARTNVTGYNGVNLVAYTISSGTGGKNLLFIHGRVSNTI